MHACPDCGLPTDDDEERCPYCVAAPVVEEAASEAIPESDDGDPVAEPLRLVDELIQEMSTTDSIFLADDGEPEPPVETPSRPIHAPAATATPWDDRRHVGIDAVFEVPSVPADDDPLVHLLVTLSPGGLPLLDPTSVPVAHVILALDVSASMNRTDKYPLLTEALGGMLYELQRPGGPDVLVSVVVYAYGAETILRDVPASHIDPRDVVRRVDASPLRFGRYTDVVGALGRAGRIAFEQVTAQKAMPTRIVLLTDGRPQDMDGARGMMERIRRMPVDVEALAFGDDADVEALQELVSGSRGGTVKQIRPDTIAEAFGRIGDAAARVISNRSLVDFELAPGIVGGAAYRYRPARHRFGDEAFAGGRTFSTDLGTLEAGRRYSLLFQLRLPEAAAGETEVGRLTVRLPGFGGARLFESLVSIQRHTGRAVFSPDREVVAAREVLTALGGTDPVEQLRALRTRRKLYETERRDPRLLAVIDHAIAELEERGSLVRLSESERATILSHTCTAGSLR